MGGGAVGERRPAFRPLEEGVRRKEMLAVRPDGLSSGKVGVGGGAAG